MNTTCRIRSSKEKILQIWEKASIEKFPNSTGMSRLAIRDHLPNVFDALCTILETGIYKSPENLSKVHGQQRFSFGNYTLLEVMEEYSLLKNVIFDEMIALNELTLKEVRLIDRFFDSASSTAAVEFVELREQELKNISRTLELSNFDLQTFAAIAAHDLKSPTATIVGFAQLALEDSPHLPHTAQRSMQTIEKTSIRMLSLIDRLLEYAKIGTGKLKTEKFSLLAVAEEAKLNLTSEANTADAFFVFHRLPDFEGDRVLMAQLFQNIFANSLKFRSPDRPLRIEVIGSQTANSIELTIKDSGLGFDPRLNHEIFQPFKRGDADVAGNGLGLATVKKIVSMHGGSVHAIGTPDVGAEIKISLPCGKYSP